MSGKWRTSHAWRVAGRPARRAVFLVHLDEVVGVLKVAAAYRGPSHPIGPVIRALIRLNRLEADARARQDEPGGEAGRDGQAAAAAQVRLNENLGAAAARVEGESGR